MNEAKNVPATGQAYTPEQAMQIARAESGREPKTAGINPAHRGALQVLQFHAPAAGLDARDAIRAAAREISTYHQLDAAQRVLVDHLQKALEEFLIAIVMTCPSGPERSTAISRAREAKFWAAAGIALEGK